MYNDFLEAAWNLAGELAHGNVELVEPNSSRIEIDPECEFRLCVQDPEKLDMVKAKLAEFERQAGYVCVSREETGDEKEKTA